MLTNFQVMEVVGVWGGLVRREWLLGDVMGKVRMAGRRQACGIVECEELRFLGGCGCVVWRSRRRSATSSTRHIL